MIRLLSIGISSETFSDKTISHHDAKLIYQSFNFAFQDHFDSSISHCLFDATPQDVAISVRQLASSATETDIFVFYYCGHGRVFDGKLCLGAHKSEEDDISSWIHFSDLTQTVRRLDKKAVFILDCCHAGAGFPETQKNTLDSPGDIFVIASSQYFEFQNADSSFANSLSSALKKTHGGGLITLHSLLSAMESNVYASLSEGSYDLTLLSEGTGDQVRGLDFSCQFLKAFNLQSPSGRELLLYSLASWDHRTVMAILESILKEGSNSAFQPCWLVRRALGSLLAQNLWAETAQDLVRTLFASQHWMLNSIALIAARNNKTDEHRQLLKGILLSNQPASLTWLANLYLSEFSPTAINISLSSSLKNTLWGLIDIFERYSDTPEFVTNPATLLNILRKQSSREFEDSLLLHAALKGISNESDSPLLANNLVKHCYSRKATIRNFATEKKWLLSTLYGDWRGLGVLDLNTYFSQTAPRTIMKDLIDFQHVPSVESKVTLLTYLSGHTEFSKPYLKELEWVKGEQHPWVRKQATLLFSAAGLDIQTTFPLDHYQVDRHNYVGFYDYLLRVCHLYSSKAVEDFLLRHELPCIELEAVISDIACIQSQKYRRPKQKAVT